MKKILILATLLLLIACGGQKPSVNENKENAPLVKSQVYTPYSVKSGKIVYHSIRYSMKVSFSSINGKESSSRSLIPYLSEERIYYWDNFGDKAFEEIWQVSKFGGKPLDKKVKIAQRLWLGDKRYYYDNKKVTIDPWHSKLSSKKEKYGTYQSVKNVAGKKSKLYRESAYTDKYIWQGLSLRNVNFSTSKGKRSEIHTETKAIEVQIIPIDAKLFHPKWL